MTDIVEQLREAERDSLAPSNRKFYGDCANEIETLRRSLAAAKQVIKAKEAVQIIQDEKLKALDEAVDTLASERAANAMLTDEIETLRQRVKELIDINYELEEQARALKAGAYDGKKVAELKACRQGEPVEASAMSHHSRAMLLNIIWHHQGAGSAVGQPLRRMLGIEQFARLTDDQVSEAKWIECLLSAAPKPKETQTCFAAGDMADAAAKAFQEGAESNRAATDELLAALKSMFNEYGEFDYTISMLNNARAAIAKHEPKP